MQGLCEAVKETAALGLYLSNFSLITDFHRVEHSNGFELGFRGRVGLRGRFGSRVRFRSRGRIGFWHHQP